MVIGGRAKLLLDNDFTILEGDDGFYALSGYSRNEFIRECKNKCRNNMKGADHRLLINKLNKNPDINTIEFRIYTKDNLIRWINGTFDVVGYQGAIPVIEGLFCDVTSYKTEQYETSILYDNIPGAIVKYLMNEHIDILDANSKFYEMFGTTPADYTNGPLTRFNDTMKKQTLDIAKRAAATREDLILEYKTSNKKTGEDVWIHWEGRYVDMLNGYPVYLAVLMDITYQKTLEQELQHMKNLYSRADDLIEMANRDPLTGIDNRGAFRSKVEAYRLSSECTDSFALLMLDLDGFKGVNDTCGHLFGDDILCCVTDILKSHMNADTLIGRFGGDEFLIFVKHADYKSVCRLADTINREISAIDVKEAPSIAGSIGGILTSDVVSSYKLLIKTADEALYEVKSDGKNNHIIKTELSII